MSHAAALVIGVDDIPQKEQMVLRSLLRLLDGRLGTRLTFSESLRDCNVIFARQGVREEPAPGPALLVRVLSERGDTPSDLPDGLCIQAPLRMSNVMETLRACADSIRSVKAPSGKTCATRGWAPLFIDQGVSASRGCEAYLLDGDRLLLIDYRNDRVYVDLPLQELIEARFELSPVQLDAAQQDEALRTLSAHGLRDLMWSLAHRLGQDEPPAEALAGCFRLLRWPDAVALRQPGFPRLAALLVNRPLDVSSACAASGVSPAGVQGFLKVALALGIAVPAEGLPDNAPSAAPPAAPGSMRSMITRLRDRLKLW